MVLFCFSMILPKYAPIVSRRKRKRTEKRGRGRRRNRTRRERRTIMIVKIMSIQKTLDCI